LRAIFLNTLESRGFLVAGDDRLTRLPDGKASIRQAAEPRDSEPFAGAFGPWQISGISMCLVIGCGLIRSPGAPLAGAEWFLVLPEIGSRLFGLERLILVEDRCIRLVALG
jgi:hypothetical protein